MLFARKKANLSTTPSESPTVRSRRFPWFTVLKAGIALLVVVCIGRAIRESRLQFAQSNFSLSNTDVRWLLVAVAAYLVGMLPMTLNWHRLLHAMGAAVPRGPTVRAHYMSQLGKYVPGKAIVVAIRMSLLSSYGVKTSSLLASIVAETLAMMSVGAVMASGIVLVLYWNRVEIALTAAGLAVLATVPILPPVLRLGLRILQSRRLRKAAGVDSGSAEAAAADDLTKTLTWKAVLPGWLGIFPGWVLLGLSMFATMKAMNLPETANMSLLELPWVIAAYAISVVAGFLSMLPGGVGVREVVMKEMIEPSYGPVVALLAPVFHRMMSLSAELIMATWLYLIASRTRRG